MSKSAGVKVAHPTASIRKKERKKERKALLTSLNWTRPCKGTRMAMPMEREGAIIILGKI